MALIVRRAGGADAESLTELAEPAFRATYEGLVDPATIDAVVSQTCDPARFVDLAARKPPAQLLVADEDGLLQGFLDFAEEPDGLELRRLYTRTGQTSRGVGSALLAHLEAALRAGTTYRIVVAKANVRGVAFWERHGFSATSEVDGVEHFAEHRQVSFRAGTGTARLLVMHRTVGHPNEQAGL